MAIIPNITKPESSGESIKGVAVNWLFFWLVEGIMILKDVIDIFLGAIEGVATGTVVGIPIAVFCAIVGGFMTFTVAIIAMLYHLYYRKRLVTKLLITGICALIGMIPFLGAIIPDASAGFFAAFLVGGITNRVSGAKNSTTGETA